MGNRNSTPVLNAKKNKNTSNRKRQSPKSSSGTSSGDSSGNMISFPLTAFESVTNGVKNLTESYNTFRNGQVQRGETKLNGAAMRSVVPDVKAFLGSLTAHFKQRNILELFQSFLMGANTIAYWVEVLHGNDATVEIGRRIHSELEAHIGLLAPRLFARQVNVTIKEQMASIPSNNFFFLYHPDTTWHGEFFEIVQNNPLPANYLGMSTNLDAIVIWMLFLRRHLPKGMRSARFHLFIPAYRPMLIKDPLIFPEELYPLTIRGIVHNSKPLVWFDLPTIDDVHPDLFELHHIGNLSQPPSNWRGPVAATAATAAGGVGIAISAVATVAAVPFIGPFAGVIWLGAGAGSLVGAGMVHDQVDSLFARPNPRLIGQRHEQQEPGIRGDDENNLTFQPVLRRVSRRPRQRGRRREGQQNGH